MASCTICRRNTCTSAIPLKSRPSCSWSNGNDYRTTTIGKLQVGIIGNYCHSTGRLVLILPSASSPNRTGVVLTFGKFERVISSGFHLNRSFTCHTVNTALHPRFNQQVVITKDNAEISSKISLKYHVTNIEDFVLKQRLRS